MWLLIVDYFIIQKRNAITIHHSIATARQKESGSGINVNHDYGNEFLDYDSITNVYFIGDVDGKDIIDSIIHPVFYKEINKFIKNIKTNKIVIEIPLVETCKSLDMDHVVIYVDTEKLIRKTRYLEKKSTDDMTFESLDEFQIDLSDVSLNGTSDSIDAMSVLIPRF